jgi:3-oxoacyl-[acyl-carrier-protein] synthase-3
VTNDDLVQIMDTNDEWITKRTGVEQRHCSGLGLAPLTSPFQPALMRSPMPR